MISMVAQSVGARADTDVTYEKVTTSERNPAFCVPFLAIQEIEGILQDSFFHTDIEDDGFEGAFRTGGDEAPFVPHVGGIDRNLFSFRLLPALLGFCEEILNELLVPTEDATRRDQPTGIPGGGGTLSPEV
jgi:hypothetical protein